VKLGVGVIGATGHIGTPYRAELRESAEEARIVAVCARRRDRLEAAAEDGAQLVTDDWRAVVEHPEVNLVLVCTPDALHIEPVLACAEQGKHLFCEKPIGKNVDEAYRMWNAYRDTRLGHYVPFWSRYVPVFARARQLVAEGKLGQVRAVIYRWHNPRPAGMPFTWRDDADLSSSGSLGDVGSHAYDAVRWILGEEAKRVLAHADTITPAKPDLGSIDLAEALDWGSGHGHGDADRKRKGTAFDYAQVAVEFSSGAVGAMVISHASYLRKQLAPELELHGTEASLSLDRIRWQLVLARPDRTEPEVLETLPFGGFGNRFSQYVLSAIRERSTGAASDHPGLEDGWRVQMFTDAAAASARRGEWVDLGEMEP